MTYINSKLLLKQKGTLVITNKIDKNGNLIVKVDPITNENGNLVLKVEPLTLTDKQQQYKKSIQKIKERPYDYFKISHELQNDPGIIAQALLGFKSLEPKETDKQMVDFIIVSLEKKLEKYFADVEVQNEKVR